MDDPRRGHRREPVRERREDLDDLREREALALRASPVDVIVEAHAVDPLHDDVGDAAMHPVRVHRDHAGMRDRRQRLGFVAQRDLTEPRPMDLDGDAPPKRVILRFVHLSHTARAEELADLVDAVEELAGREQRLARRFPWTGDDCRCGQGGERLDGHSLAAAMQATDPLRSSPRAGER